MGWVDAIQNRFQYYLDQFHYRWMATTVLAFFYVIRFYLSGSLFTTFIMMMIVTPMAFDLLLSVVDPDNPDRLSLPVSSDVPPLLPIKDYDELRPFVPLVSEFQFWRAFTVVLCVALCVTFIPMKPVFSGDIWYIFFIVWVFNAIISLLNHREYMIKHKYIPFYYGDKKRGEYKGK